MVSDDAIVVKWDRKKPYLGERNPSLYWLVMPQVDTGQVKQAPLLTDEKTNEARIEVTSASGLLLSLAGREFRRYGLDFTKGSKLLVAHAGPEP